MDGFIPFSRRVGNELVRFGAAPSRVTPIHVGLDLERWSPRRVAGTQGSGPTKLLFVGGDFERKGGPLLLEAFARRFAKRSELHIVTKQAPRCLPPGVFVHDDLVPNDGRLIELYGAADVFVVPTLADTGPLWAYLEAMAMGLPVIGTCTGANSEIVQEGVTGMTVGVGDGASLTSALELLVGHKDLRDRMGAAGRALVESSYDASVNVPRILGVMKQRVDQERFRSTRSRLGREPVDHGTR